MSIVWSPFARQETRLEYETLHLKPRTFRVIKLLPPIRSLFPPFRETLRIEVNEVDVDDAAGEYDTLSYCWGEGAADRAVAVSLPNQDENHREYRTIHISASLEAALLSLARDNSMGAQRPIFADQICINQTDKVEKIQQVRLMGEIYAGSARTVVWLGEATTETRRYFDFATEISSEGVISRMMGPNVGHYMNVFDAVMDSSIELETEAEKEDRVDLLDLITRYGPRFPLHGLTETLRRAWVNRLWTVQEGCLPPNVVFRCGSNSSCYDCVRGTLLFYSLWTTYWLRMPKAPVPKEEVRARERIYTLNQPFLRLIKERKMIHVTRSQRRSLYDVVVQYNVNDERPKIGATRAEDRVYALLGLAGDDEIYRETVEKMEISNVRGTFTNFATSVFRRNPDILLFSQTPKSSTHGHTLPSWVPDWSADPLRTPHGYSDPTTPIFSAGGRQADCGIAAAAAAAATATAAVADASSGVLRVDAIPVGRVIRVGARSIQRNEDAVIDDIEYMSARHFFEEINEFMEVAARIDSQHAPDHSDEQHRLESTIRLSDGGLSGRQFPTRYNSTTAQGVLQDIHQNVARFGKKLIDVEAQTRSLGGFVGMIRSAGIMPWHWTPASEMDVVRLCALDPLVAARTWMQGLSLTISDVALVLWYVAKVRLVTTMVELRRKWAKVDLHGPDHGVALAHVGLNTELLKRPEWEHYTSNLFRNIGRRLFVTDTGYVGLGPSHMGVGDAVVIIAGASVPHILRPRDSPLRPEGCYGNPSSCPWSYVGEAYCDGVMDGELADKEGKRTSHFEIG